jgi:hypothetical protein
MVHQLIWASRATRSFEPLELARLVAEARRKNALRDVSGILIYDAGGFVQVLEGSESAVEQLFREISRDPRHRDVVVINRGPIAQRVFPEWPMGLLELTAQVRALPGVSEFLRGSSRPRN